MILVLRGPDIYTWERGKDPRVRARERVYRFVAK